MHSLSIPLLIFIIEPPFHVLTIPGNQEVEELKTLWESSTEEVIDLLGDTIWENDSKPMFIVKLKLNYNQNNQRFMIVASRDSLFFYLPKKIQSKTHIS
jgi:hypothetical protein